MWLIVSLRMTVARIQRDLKQVFADGLIYLLILYVLKLDSFQCDSEKILPSNVDCDIFIVTLNMVFYFSKICQIML